MMPELINRAPFERDLTEALARILEKARRNLVNALYHEGFTQRELANIPLDVLQDLRADLLKELQQAIPPAFVDTARDYAGLLAYALDETQLQAAAQTWMAEFLPDLVNGMLDTTATELRRIAQTAPDVPLERRVLLGILGGVALFGVARAIAVARTTATHINSAAENAINEDLRQSPAVVEIEEIFYTKEDERVCPQCLPLHEKVLDENDERPPLHPNCRCERKYRITYSDGTVVIVRSSEEAGKPVQIQKAAKVSWSDEETPEPDEPAAEPDASESTEQKSDVDES
jgi:hypothetical protein